MSRALGVVCGRREPDFVGVPREEPSGVGRRRAPVEIFRKLGRSQRRTYLPAHARGAVPSHLLDRWGRHVERVAGGVTALIIADNHSDRAIQHLEMLVLLRVKVPRR
jgi:hypothetical protein